MCVRCRCAHCADGLSLLSLVVTLPTSGTLLQLDGTIVAVHNVVVTDPRDRLIYSPNAFARGQLADSLQFVSSPVARPVQRILHSLAGVHGDAAAVLALLPSEWTTAHAWDCGGVNPAPSSLCAADANAARLTYFINATVDNRVATASGLAATTNNVSFMKFTIASASVLSTVVATTAAQRAQDPRSFYLSFWVRPAAVSASAPSTMFAGYNGDHTALLLQLLPGAAPDSGNRTLLARARCAYITGSAAEATMSLDLPLGKWSHISLTWTRNFSSVLVQCSLQSVQLQLTLVPHCVPPANAPSPVQVTGLSAATLGAEIATASTVHSPTDVPSPNGITQNHLQATFDEVHVYTVFNSKQQQCVERRDAIVDPDARQSSCAGAELLASFSFDSPFGLYWQPPELTTPNPALFRFPTEVQVRCACVGVLLLLSLCC